MFDIAAAKSFVDFTLKIISFLKIVFVGLLYKYIFNSYIQVITSTLNIGTYFSFITSIFNVFIVIRFFLARKSFTSSVFHRLHDDWNSEEVYLSMKYIHDLRKEWKGKEKDQRKWDRLAREWVEDHTEIDPIKDEKLSKEMMKRRSASQFMSRTGIALKNGYILPDDLFGIVPETGRILSVLIPIEIEIEKHWKKNEDWKLRDWDMPMPKWVFNNLFDRYIEWYEENKNNLKLNPIDWDSLQ